MFPSSIVLAILVCGHASSLLPSETFYSRLSSIQSTIAQGKLLEATALLQEINLDHFALNTDQLQRATVPLCFSLDQSDDSSITISLKTFPVSHSLPIHRRSESLYLKVVSGRLTYTEYIIDENASVDDESITTVTTSCNIDGFISADGEEEDDCVCRGGVCPRRWGCQFWVDYMAKKHALVLQAIMQPPQIEGSDDRMKVLESDKQHPFSLCNEGSETAVLLEVSVNEGLTGVEREGEGEGENITFYHKQAVTEEREGQVFFKVLPTPPAGSLRFVAKGKL